MAGGCICGAGSIIAYFQYQTAEVRVLPAILQRKVMVAIELEESPLPSKKGEEAVHITVNFTNSGERAVFPQLISVS